MGMTVIVQFKASQVTHSKMIISFPKFLGVKIHGNIELDFTFAKLIEVQFLNFNDYKIMYSLYVKEILQDFLQQQQQQWVLMTFLERWLGSQTILI